MWSTIKAAANYENGIEPAEIQRYHFSNHAVSQVLQGDGNNGIYELHRMWEDSDIWGSESAKDVANFIESLMPGKWVLIDTGDYIMKKLDGSAPNGQETYDPDYALILVHAATFEKYKNELERIDSQWRTEKENLAIGCALPQPAV